MKNIKAKYPQPDMIFSKSVKNLSKLHEVTNIIVKLKKKSQLTKNNKNLISSTMIVETLDYLLGVLIKKNYKVL